ncbi:MAG: hypothetical protein HS115_00680 [Spirochaetales bacterium]|nr:hypothetical protein [Spirochaetales bacterium]
MWIASKYGFYSIVKKADGLHVRARLMKDLENLITAARIKKSILTWPDADYRYRIIVDDLEYSQIVAALQASVDYPNFKNMIHQKGDQKRKYEAYSRIWGTLYDLQE